MQYGIPNISPYVRDFFMREAGKWSFCVDAESPAFAAILSDRGWGVEDAALYKLRE